jgi:hypothetical protein
MTLELDVARRLVNEPRLPAKEWIEWVKVQPTIVWTPDGQEPDIIKAIVWNQILVSDLELQRAALAALLSHVKEMSSERLKALLSRHSVTALLAMCVDHYNLCNLGSSEAELVEPSAESRYPQICILRKIIIQ